MLGITKACEEMKKKISFGDYAFSEQPQMAKARKTYLLTQEDGEKLKVIFSNRVAQEVPTSVNGLVSEAIELLYAQEMEKSKFDSL